MRLLISRTDAIGDVSLTLPAIGWLKTHLPNLHISLLVNSYAAVVAKSCRWLDAVVELPDGLSVNDTSNLLREIHVDHIVHVFPRKAIALAAKRAEIPRRSGVVGRPYHWFTCTDFVWMSRSRSNYHEAYLNILLLSKIFDIKPPTPPEMMTNFVKWGGIELPKEGIQEHPPYVILHPYSRGSGREWPIVHFAKLATLLVEHGYIPVVGGTAAEAVIFSEYVSIFPKETINAMGNDSLEKYMLRINGSQSLVVSGSGPLHLASLLGVPTVGLFPPLRSINSKRWGAIGNKSINLELQGLCSKKCSNRKCACLFAIAPEAVMDVLKDNLPCHKQENV